MLKMDHSCVDKLTWVRVPCGLLRKPYGRVSRESTRSVGQEMQKTTSLQVRMYFEHEKATEGASSDTPEFRKELTNEDSTLFIDMDMDFHDNLRHVSFRSSTHT